MFSKIKEWIQFKKKIACKKPVETACLGQITGDNKLAFKTTFTEPYSYYDTLVCK